MVRKKQRPKLPAQYLHPWPVEHQEFYTAFRSRLEMIADLTGNAVIIGINRRDTHNLNQAVPVIKLLAERLLREAKMMHPLRNYSTPKWVNAITDSLISLVPQMVKQAGEVATCVRLRDWEGAKTRLDFCHDAAELILSSLLDGPKPEDEQPLADTLMDQARRITWAADQPLSEARKSKNSNQKTRLPDKPKHARRVGGKRKRSEIPQAFRDDEE